MNSRIKQYILIAVIAVAGYFVLSNHFIFYGTQVHLHYTFYSVKAKRPSIVMKIDCLREAGIGDLLVELGMIDQEQRAKLESEYSYE